MYLQRRVEESVLREAVAKEGYQVRYFLPLTRKRKTSRQQSDLVRLDENEKSVRNQLVFRALFVWNKEGGVSRIISPRHRSDMNGLSQNVTDRSMETEGCSFVC